MNKLLPEKTFVLNEIFFFRSLFGRICNRLVVLEKTVVCTDCKAKLLSLLWGWTNYFIYCLGNIPSFLTTHGLFELLYDLQKIPAILDKGLP